MSYWMKLFGAALLLGLSGVAWSAVNVNTADAATLARELHGVGEKLGAAIVEERKKGPFASVEDLEKRVKGWGPKASEKNRDAISFGAPKTTSQTAPTPGKPKATREPAP